MSEWGHVTMVTTEPVASTVATADALAGATELVVEYAGDFPPDGEQIVIAGGSPVAYTAITWGEGEDEPDILTLAAPLVADVFADDVIELAPNGQRQSELIAHVVTEDGDSLEVAIPYVDRLAWPNGIYERPVPVEISEDGDTILNAPGVPPRLSGQTGASDVPRWAVGEQGAENEIRGYAPGVVDPRAIVKMGATGPSNGEVIVAAGENPADPRLDLWYTATDVGWSLGTDVVRLYGDGAAAYVLGGPLVTEGLRAEQPTIVRETTTSQSIPDATFTTVTYADTLYSKGAAAFSSGRFYEVGSSTDPAGTYLVTGHVAWSASTVGRRQVRLVSGDGATEFWASDLNPGVPTVGMKHAISAVVTMSPDLPGVKVEAYQTTGGALDITSARVTFTRLH